MIAGDLAHAGHVAAELLEKERELRFRALPVDVAAVDDQRRRLRPNPADEDRRGLAIGAAAVGEPENAGHYSTAFCGAGLE